MKCARRQDRDDHRLRRAGARIADEAGVELILVGDTAAMVMLGHYSTLPVTLDEMIFLTRAVTRAARLIRSSSATCRSGRTRSPTSRPSRARSG